MKNPNRSQVLAVLAVLASLLLCSDAASQSGAPTSTPSITLSGSGSVSVSGSVSGTLSPSYSNSVSGSISTTYSPSAFYTSSGSISTSPSYSPSISGSISNTFTASCTFPQLQDRCKPQVTTICLFYTLLAGVCPPPVNPATGNSTYVLVIINGSGGTTTIESTFKAGVTPQFPTDGPSTKYFIVQGATYMFQVFQVTPTGAFINPSNIVIKSLPPDNRNQGCTTLACELFCGVFANSALCQWRLGSLRLKRAEVRVVACYNPLTYQQVAGPENPNYRTPKFRQISNVTVSECPANALCFVELSLHYATYQTKPLGIRGQQRAKFGVFCPA